MTSTINLTLLMMKMLVDNKTDAAKHVSLKLLNNINIAIREVVHISYSIVHYFLMYYIDSQTKINCINFLLNFVDSIKIKYFYDSKYVKCDEFFIFMGFEEWLLENKE